MGFFNKISSLFSGSQRADSEAFVITVRCNRCGEVIHARVDLNNDLSAEYGEDGATTYYCRKQLIGEGTGELPCFQRVEVKLTFDANKRLTGEEISGGQFLN